ncbi:target of Nesh-SH3 [Anarrhichthys ocellatus]|uniref:target of Nesh-SH3 n=1 Tax=Anarrhichthys ocellatus TaxID=433405 RepID=UPI0012ED84F7|nr:target of Nesh-SH3-like [Anarrhichthys ocellatus]
MCLCFCVCMVLSIWASLVSADVFWVTFFPPLKSTRDITHQAISDLYSSQENATELLSEDGQSRWITTVYDYESDDEGEQLIYSPPPAALSSDKPMDLKQGDKESILKPFPLVTAKPKQERRQRQTTTSAPAVNTSRFDINNENSSIFRPLPTSEVDIMGKKRFVAPHVIYKTDKKPDEPCSITSSLTYFPDEEGGDQNVTGPPRIPPSNLTVVTVEGCPSFIILDWQKSDNETKEYEVVSTTKGPNGEEVSVLTTNQTHTAVENLNPESSYEFTVTPKNEMGTGPSSDPVSFSTESADPRVSEHVSGKDAIWTQFPFKSDDYSECNGKQYVKRTWYRKFVGIQLCNSLRYKIYLSDSLNGKFYNIGDQTGHGEDHCQFVDSFLDGRTGTQMFADQLPSRPGFYRALRQEPVHFGEIGGKSHVTYVGWYECGTPIPGKW